MTHTTSGVSDKAELHMVRAVDTGVINVGYTRLQGMTSLIPRQVSLAVQESEHKLNLGKEPGPEPKGKAKAA